MDQQRGLYVVCHEFGHARDHALRADAAEISDPRAEAFSINDTARYYGHIVLTEYAACRNALSVMTAPLFNDEMLQAGGRMVECQRQVNNYLGDPDQLTRRALAHVICQGAWVFMVELTKLYGHAGGSEERAAEVRAFETALLEKTRLEDVLGRYGKTYPQWDTASQIEELTELWQHFSAIFGVRFITSGGRDDFDRIT